jgi:glycerol-3-phosphate dehydrogenase (NAD+)
MAILLIMSPLISLANELKVSIIGGGNFGTAMACLIGRNIDTQAIPAVSSVSLWVLEELHEGKKLSDIINSGENTKYLPGIRLPKCVRCTSNIEESCTDADIIILAVPHQFLHSTLLKMKNYVKSTAIAVSLVKVLWLTLKSSVKCDHFSFSATGDPYRRIRKSASLLDTD